MTYAENLAAHGGMATCGEHCGVMVAPQSAVAGCPRGWIFVPLETATPELVRECLDDANDDANRGRSQWPKDD